MHGLIAAELGVHAGRGCFGPGSSPWGPLHEANVVTVFGGEPPHNVNDHVSPTAAGILATVADTAVSLGSNVG